VEFMNCKRRLESNRFSRREDGGGGDGAQRASSKRRTVPGNASSPPSRRGEARGSQPGGWLAIGGGEHKCERGAETSLTCAHFVGLLSPGRPDATRRRSSSGVSREQSLVRHRQLDYIVFDHRPSSSSLVLAIVSCVLQQSVSRRRISWRGDRRSPRQRWWLRPADLSQVRVLVKERERKLS